MRVYNWFQRKAFWINDFFHGSEMWKAFKEIKYINEHPVEGEIICQKKLKDIIAFAKANTEFYSHIESNELRNFPVINKQTILANKEAFLVSPDMIPGQKGELFIKTTSGSSGTPFSLPQDTNCRTRLIAMIKYGNELVGFHSFERLMHLRSFKHYWLSLKEKKISTKLNKSLNIVYADNSDLNEEKALEICKAINEYKVKFIRGYMTSMDIITQCAIKNGISFPEHPVFISGGERVKDSLRKRVIEDLHCSIISQYANEENGVMAQTAINEEDSYQILLRGNCYIEILKFDSDEPVQKGELGRIVVTDFTNHAMPMIRYDIGDVGTIGEEENGVLLSISDFSGRKTDLIINTKGEYIDFFNSMSADIYLNYGIITYQFIQKGPKTYVLKLNLRDNSLKAKEQDFIDMVRKTVGEDAEVIIDFVDEIPVLSSGKRKVIVNEWKS